METQVSDRNFKVETLDDYSLFWEHEERKAIISIVALELFHGSAVQLSVEPGDMTQYKYILRPTGGDLLRAMATYANPGFAKEDSVDEGLIVKLTNCGEGQAHVSLFDQLPSADTYWWGNLGFGRGGVVKPTIYATHAMTSAVLNRWLSLSA